MEDSSPILVADQGAVRLVTLNRPHRLNALNQAMSEAIQEVLAESAEDDRVAALVFTGAGRAFSAGADLEMFDRIRVQGGAERFTDSRFPLALLDFPKPMLAAINGPAVGWGATMPLLCDLRLAASQAVFQFPFVNLGLTPEFVASWFLPRLVGLAKASELVLTAARFDAEAALAMGLVSRVTPGEELLDQAMELAQNIAAKPPLAIRRAKGLLRAGLTGQPKEVMEMEVDLFCQGLAGEEFGAELPKIMKAVGKKAAGSAKI